MECGDDRAVWVSSLGIVMLVFFWDVYTRESEFRRLEERLEWLASDSELRISLLERNSRFPEFGKHASSCDICRKNEYCEDGARILKEEVGTK
jgi:hypothetical protein